MDLTRTEYSFFPFLSESKAEFKESFNLVDDLSSDELLSVAVKRIKSGVIEDSSVNINYTPEKRFKSNICAIALLTILDNPVYTYNYLRSESHIVYNTYTVKKLLQVLDVNITSITSLDSELIQDSELSDRIIQFDSSVLASYAKRYCNNDTPIEFQLASDSSEKVFEELCREIPDSTFYLLSVSNKMLNTGLNVNFTHRRLYDNKILFTEQELKKYIIHYLMLQFSNKYPINIEKLPTEVVDTLTDKSEFCIAQLPKVTYPNEYEELAIEHLPATLQSIYMRCDSNPQLVSEEEYQLFFSILYRLGFTSDDIIEYFTLETPIGENYMEELIQDSNVSRRSDIETWTDVDQTVNCYVDSPNTDIYRSLSKNPVEYYELAQYINNRN